jgi:hypothetical protein
MADEEALRCGWGAGFAPRSGVGLDDSMVRGSISIWREGLTGTPVGTGVLLPAGGFALPDRDEDAEVDTGVRVTRRWTTGE